ncbi:MAG: hypothetical protein ACLSHE_12035 [Roseburia sp.]
MQIWLPPQKIFISGFTYLLRTDCDFAKRTKKKAANLFQTYCFSLPPVTVGYSVVGCAVIL